MLKHLAVIPDWNRTRAKKNWKTTFEGYLYSVDVAVKLIKYIFSNTDIDVFTGWGMSTENVKNRPTQEIEFLFGIFKQVWEILDEFMREKKINFVWIWNPEGISDDFLNFLAQKTKNFHFPESEKKLVFAINYGWKDEIVRGVKKFVQNNLENSEALSNITMQDISENMDLWAVAPVDMIIRTKWDVSSRLSGFMSRWAGYAELYFSPKLYPDFDTSDLDEALAWFEKVKNERNFGK